MTDSQHPTQPENPVPTIADAVLQHLEGEVRIPPPSPVPQLEAEHLQHSAGSTLPPSRSSYESSTARARSELSVGDVYRLVRGQIDELKRAVGDQKLREEERVREIMGGIGDIMREVRAGVQENERTRKMHERNYELLRSHMNALDGAQSGIVDRLNKVEPELARVGRVADDASSRLDELEEQIRSLLARPTPN